MFTKIGNVVTRIRKTLWFKIFLGVMIVGVLYAGFVYSLIFSAYRDVPPPDCKVLIVLGARVYGKENPHPSPILMERLDAAYEYLVENEETVVIVTGGRGANEWAAEGDVMAEYLIAKGIDESRIIIENKSTSTIENIAFASELYDISEAVIVTNDFHLYRAMRTARQNGVDTVYGLAAVSRTYKTFESYLREVLALGYHLLFTN